MECTGERKREGGRVDMPTTKWRAGCACERLSKFSKCREREREKRGERERDLTKKWLD